MVQQQQIQQEPLELREGVGVPVGLADLPPQHVLPRPVLGTEVEAVTHHIMAGEAEVDLHLLALAQVAQVEATEETDTPQRSLEIQP
jgi:hypothetical protein